MKPSVFNVFTTYNNKIYISNTLTKAVACIDEEHVKALSSKDNRDLKNISSSLPSLRENGFVVDKDFDEIGSLRYAYQQSKNSTDEIEFVVAPTMNCNFKCSYCFETQRQGKMSKNTQEAVINFIKTKVNELKPKKVRYIWFGGEPLLCVDIIEHMSSDISLFLKKCNVDLEMIVITNGYFATKKTIERLEKVGVTHFQITIDGDKSTHDKRRVLHNGNGTYDVIFNNLLNFSDYNVTVGIRVNIDKDNIGIFSSVKKEIDKLNNHKIKCHPALVEPAANHDQKRKNVCYRNECQEYYDSPDIKEYYSKMDLESLGIQLCYCGAEHNNSFAIDEKGNIYKCWNSMGYDDKILTTVFDSDHKNSKVVATYLGRDPFTEKSCINCPYIPICGGGCIEQRLVNGVNSCSAQRYIYDSVIKRKVDSL